MISTNLCEWGILWNDLILSGSLKRAGFSTTIAPMLVLAVYMGLNYYLKKYLLAIFKELTNKLNKQIL